MFNFLSQSLLGFIFWLNGFFQDLGLSLVVFTFILKIILFPLELLSFLEEEKLKKLRPKINEILKRYKNDFLKQSDELNELYKKEKYNPFLTLIIQFLPLPIFISIFFALNQLLKTHSSEIFLFSIDLSRTNIFLSLSVIILQFLFIFNLSKDQQKFFLIFFGLMVVILIKLPAIYNLYWLTNLILTLIERPIFRILGAKINIKTTTA